MTAQTFTQQQINDIVAEAKQAAFAAADKFFQERLGGQDQYACGFAWTNIYGVKGNTRLGKMLKAAGVTQDYTKAFQLWNPSGLGCQNVGALQRCVFGLVCDFLSHLIFLSE